MPHDAVLDAREVLSALWSFILVGLIFFFRLLTNPLLYLGNNGGPYLLKPPAVWVAAAAPLLFFFVTSASDILSLMREDPAWGVMAATIGIGIAVIIGLTERIHHQNARYIDLLTDADPAVTSARKRREDSTLKFLRIGAATWVVLFAIGVYWLWKIAHPA